MRSASLWLDCALLSANVSRIDIKRMLRWRGDEALDTYARLNDEQWREYVNAIYNSNVNSTVAARIASIGPIDLESAAARYAAAAA